MSKNKYGKPLCYEACITIEKGKHVVRNIGRLVLETYVGFAPDGKPEIDHIDRNPLNNNLANLRWANRSENCKNRFMNVEWKKDRHDKRVATALAKGYKSWGEMLLAGKEKAKAKSEQDKQQEMNND